MDIDIVHNKVLKNMEIIESLIKILKNTPFNEVSTKLSKKYNDKIVIIESRYTKSINRYLLVTINILNRHYMKQCVNDEYTRAISRYNIFNEIDHQIKDISEILHVANKLTTAKKSLISSNICDIQCKIMSMRGEVFVIESNVTSDICCGTQMSIISDSAEYLCLNCRKVKKIDGVMLRDQSQDGYKMKHGSYDSMRHYKFWIEHIQGKENQTFDNAFIKKLSDHLLVVQPNKKLITYKQMRAGLKNPKINASNFNEHTSLLLKLIGGTPCPILTYDENLLISHKFLRIMCIYDTLSLPSKNKPYYPYFIYKIIESVFWTSIKLQMLNYIHLQGKNTTVKNDIIYKKICEKSDPQDNLVYKATTHSSNVYQIERLLRNANLA